MPALRTEITEIVTGLGMLGFPTLAEALAARPAAMVNVHAQHWDRLTEAFAGHQFQSDFEAAWGNGRAFLQANLGLRARMPLRVEWKGRFPTPGYDLIPADLRVDHVYLVSCKYLSHILFNASPSHLFDRVLAARKGSDRLDWYLEAAAEAYRAFYAEVCRKLAPSFPEGPLPTRIEDLDEHHRRQLVVQLRGSWPAGLGDSYRAFSTAVSVASARRWQSHLSSVRAQEEMLWRLLRLASAPYFILGASTNGVLRLRVDTPWDWRRDFSLRSFTVRPDPWAGQPLVRWRALVRRLADDREIAVKGHVEIRWSHGRFCGNPEAKVYLDTSHREVPGYVWLD